MQDRGFYVAGVEVTHASDERVHVCVQLLNKEEPPSAENRKNGVHLHLGMRTIKPLDSAQPLNICCAGLRTPPWLNPPRPDVPPAAPRIDIPADGAGVLADPPANYRPSCEPVAVSTTLPEAQPTPGSSATDWINRVVSTPLQGQSSVVPITPPMKILDYIQSNNGQQQ